MRKNLLTTIILFSSLILSGQEWARIENESIDLNAVFQKKNKVLKGSIFYLDYDQFLKEWANSSSGRSARSVQFPDPDGKMTEYFIEEDVMMEEGLAKKYPQIKIFKGFDTKNERRIRLDIGYNGVNAVIISKKEGMMFLSPQFKENNSIYQSYYLKDAPESEGALTCGTTGWSPSVRHDDTTIAQLRSNQFVRHEYRYAVTCTGEWGAERGSKEKALSDIVTSVNILNSIFEVDLGMKLILVARNDELLFMDPATDPFSTPDVGRSLLPSNTGIISGIIGSASYDLGHIYTNRCTDVGGVAYLRSLCNLLKGGGVTCFSGTNFTRTVTGTLAHEIGHQLGARHTYYFCGTNAPSQGNNFEPGSGSTIMSYGGSCGQDNVVTTRDAYYHNASLIEMYQITRDPQALGYGCATRINTENIPPVITNMTPQKKLIPSGTPFILEGNAIDENNDELTYCWEQKDSNMTVGAPLGTIQTGLFPSIRSYSPVKEGYRIIPQPNSLLGNVNNRTEVLPSGDRTMNFMLTVRDNHPQGGAAVWQNTSIQSVRESGPFTVTSIPSFTTVRSDAYVNVTWNVANTDQAPIHCKFVDIYLSLDRKLYPGDPKMIPLILRTPNDGNEMVSLPSITSTLSRIVVKASDDIFFNINPSYFSLQRREAPRAYFETSSYITDLCLPEEVEISLLSKGLDNYSGKIKYEVQTEIKGITASLDDKEVTVGTPTKLKIKFDPALVVNGRYEIKVKSTGEQNDTLVRNLIFRVKSNRFEDVSFLNPKNNSKNAGLSPDISWSTSPNADYYQLRVATAPSFLKENIVFSDTTSSSVIKMGQALDINKVYYARVTAVNSCFTQQNSPVVAFGSAYVECESQNATGLPENFPSDRSRTIEATFEFQKNFDVSRVAVKNLKLDHFNFNDLTAALRAPQDSSARLFEKICPYYVEIDADFSDEFSAKLLCTNFNKKQFSPLDSFSIFKGLPSKGTWTLTLADSSAVNGGTLHRVSLELCSDKSVAHPLLTFNRPLITEPLQSVPITTDHLLARTENQADDEHLYTITQLPFLGEIFLDSMQLKTGSQFTQADVSKGRLRYRNVVQDQFNMSLPLKDSLGILVQNKNAGFAGIQFMPVQIELKTTSAPDFTLEKLIIYPNPAKKEVFLVLPPEFQNKTNKIVIFNTAGKEVMNFSAEVIKSIPVEHLHPGVYLLMIENKNGKTGGRFLVGD